MGAGGQGSDRSQGLSRRSFLNTYATTLPHVLAGIGRDGGVQPTRAGQLFRLDLDIIYLLSSFQSNSLPTRMVSERTGT